MTSRAICAIRSRFSTTPGRCSGSIFSPISPAVAVTDVREADGAAVVAEICAAGGQAAYWHLDVRQEDETARVLGEIRAKFGNVTVLVNNAGVVGPRKPTHEIASEMFDLPQPFGPMIAATPSP